MASCLGHFWWFFLGRHCCLAGQAVSHKKRVSCLEPESDLVAAICWCVEGRGSAIQTLITSHGGSSRGPLTFYPLHVIYQLYGDFSFCQHVCLEQEASSHSAAAKKKKATHAPQQISDGIVLRPGGCTCRRKPILKWGELGNLT